MKKKKGKRKKAKGPVFDKDGYEDTETFDGWRIEDSVIVPRPDFLPSPAEVARRLKKAKITILLDDGTVIYFKEEAEKNGVSYQQMIREVLRTYANQKKKRKAA